LYLAGASTRFCHGIIGSFASGKVAADLITGGIWVRVVERMTHSLGKIIKYVLSPEKFVNQ
jgi:hypothetical protein